MYKLTVSPVSFTHFHSFHSRVVGNVGYHDAWMVAVILKSVPAGDNHLCHGHQRCHICHRIAWGQAAD